MTVTVAAALAQARSVEIDRLDAHLLLGHVMGESRTWLIAHDDAPVGSDATVRFADLLRRRAAGEPVAYLVGTKEFHGLTLVVDADVLVPRPDTEVLVDWAIELVGSGALPPVANVVDLGTGSGAIALAVRRACPTTQMLATDASEKAIGVARANAQRLGLAVEFASGDWWGAVGERRFDLVVSNPPYIAGDDPHLRALQHEPTAALTPGGDGLGALRRIIAGAQRHATPRAWMLLEHGHDQAEAVRSLLLAAGWRDLETRADLAGIPRCTGGRL